jgi:hypothetical protein
MKLIFIHGREQEHKDAEFLRMTWLHALYEGLHKNKLTFPADVQVELPYYSDVMQGYTANPETIPPPLNSTRRGFNVGAIPEAIFAYDFLAELLKNAKVPESETRGGLKNWKAVRLLAQLLDRHTGLGPYLLEASYKDVYLYLMNPGVQDAIHQLFLSPLDDNDCVIVGHSLGSIMSYVFLSQQPHLRVRKLITLGSPLGMESILKRLPKPIQMPLCVQNGWYNAYDDRDLVALNELTPARFPITPAIVNHIKVDNQTENRHGIVGYLNDAAVAKQIYDALVR